MDRADQLKQLRNTMYDHMDPTECAMLSIVWAADAIREDWWDNGDHQHADGTIMVPKPTRHEAVVMAAAEATGDASNAIKLGLL